MHASLIFSGSAESRPFSNDVRKFLRFSKILYFPYSMSDICNEIFDTCQHLHIPPFSSLEWSTSYMDSQIFLF